MTNWQDMTRHDFRRPGRAVADALGIPIPPDDTPDPPPQLGLFPVDSQGRVGGDLFENTTEEGTPK